MCGTNYRQARERLSIKKSIYFRKKAIYLQYFKNMKFYIALKKTIYRSTGDK
jgi:hypothetical protein